MRYDGSRLLREGVERIVGVVRVGDGGEGGEGKVRGEGRKRFIGD